MALCSTISILFRLPRSYAGGRNSLSNSRGGPEDDVRGEGKHPLEDPRANQFGKLIRECRRLLNLTQEETRPTYTGLDAVCRTFGDWTSASVTENYCKACESAWTGSARTLPSGESRHTKLLESACSGFNRLSRYQFERNRQLHRAHKISLAEMSVLERAAPLGEPGSHEDLIFILNSVRRLLKP